jgi:hypothetical protein
VHQQPWRSPATTPAWRSPGILGPFTQAQAHTALAPVQYSDNPAPPMAEQGGWDQAGLIAALNQMSLQGSSPWVLDTGATSHMSSSAGILLSRLPPPSFGITVGNGTTIPITCRGTSTLSSPTSTYRLNNVLVAPALVRNLLYVRQFTRDNSCSIEFDACGFSVKDKQTGHVTLRCNSGGDLYTYPSTTAPSCSLATTSSLWHHRRGHHSCPYTSPQNGKAERMLCTTNNTIRTMLLHASMPPPYWAKALTTATYLLNMRPSSSIQNQILHQILHDTIPDYASLRIFGCLCYPNLTATSPHKLAPRSTPCVFLGYPSSHKGYRCLDMSTRRIITSRHVTFDESVFPFSAAPSAGSMPSSLDFLMQDHTSSTAPATTPPSLAASSEDDLQVLLDPAILQLGPRVHPAGGPQLGARGPQVGQSAAPPESRLEGG